MTIIAIEKEVGDSILIAGDQQFTGDGYRVSKPKLRRVYNQQIAWSSAGNPDIGLDKFGGWLNNYDFASSNWGTFSEQATARLAQLNSEQRKLTKTSGVEVDDSKICAEVLIAGFVSGELDARILTNDGRCFRANKFEAIGIGAKSAIVARAAVDMCQTNFDIPTILKIVMESVSGHIDDCFPPIDIWRIKGDSIEVIMGKVQDNEIKNLSTTKQAFLSDLKKASQRKPKTSQSAPKQS